MQKTDVFDALEAECCQACEAEADFPCICPHTEKILRAYMDRRLLTPMTTEQREWCLDEIGSVEGHERADYEGYPDADLAFSVIRVWVDFCRDKGLL